VQCLVVRKGWCPSAKSCKIQSRRHQSTHVVGARSIMFLGSLGATLRKQAQLMKSIGLATYQCVTKLSCEMHLMQRRTFIGPFVGPLGLLSTKQTRTALSRLHQPRQMRRHPKPANHPCLGECLINVTGNSGCL
jgi:hypothetical protein